MQFETKTALWIGGPAQLLDSNHDLAWAERSIKFNPSLKWILGKYVEADRANSNLQYWSLENLRTGQPSITNSPLNMLHQPRRIVGHFSDSEMMFPEQAADSNPFVETLAAFYSYYFPEELSMVERAHQEGQLYFSMECVSRTVTCAGCETEFEYKGPTDPSYCAHINNKEAARKFNDPTFLGGALILPPIKPGWQNASVSDISTLTQSLVEKNERECEMAYEGIKADLPDADSKTWEALMAQVVGLATDASAKLKAKTRNDLPDSAFAIPEDRAYPIHDLGHAKNALARASGKLEEARVKAAVYKKYPQLKK